MHCFHHESVLAIGLCSSCHRGLCKNCSLEVEGLNCCKASLCQERAVFQSFLSEQDKKNTILEKPSSEARDVLDWICPKCNEEVEANFGQCWNCGELKSDSVQRVRVEEQKDHEKKELEKPKDFSPWDCPRCLEYVEGHLEECWNCGEPRFGEE